MLRHTAVAAFLLAALSAQTSYADVAGSAIVVDGDTIIVAGERVRLEGIDAPELHQTCTAYGQEWACGRTSAEWLRNRLNGQQLDCIGHARDRYGRLLALCYLGGENLNERIVREGWALDYRKYSTDYLQAEATKRAGAGIWRGEFTAPWEWRPNDADGELVATGAAGLMRYLLLGHPALQKFFVLPLSYYRKVSQ